MATSLNNSKRAGRILAGLFMSACVLMFCANDAMAQRGGGGRGGGGGGGGGGRGGNSGGRTASASVSGGNRSSASGNAANRSGGNRQANTANRSGNTANRSTSNSGNRSVNNSGNRTNNGNINTGDVNINRNVDVEGGYGCCRNGVRYPVAAAVTIGAIAGTTAAVIAGSYYNALPSNCVTIVRAGASYYQCGQAYYQQSMNGDDVVYMAVDL